MTSDVLDVSIVPLESSPTGQSFVLLSEQRPGRSSPLPGGNPARRGEDELMEVFLGAGFGFLGVRELLGWAA